ncbi:hypothetical protein FACS1894202_13460 [Clostridia bacterium]|nr:hypothetical protein FACS1894202_13460 [Clostridia bacterium]
MADIFIEHMVARRKTVNNHIQSVLYVLLLISVVLAGFTINNAILNALIPFVAAGGAWLVWWLIRNQTVEFEYILTNGEIDIDRVLGRSKRKRITTVDVRNFEVFEPYDEAHFSKYKNAVFVRKFDASSGVGTDGSRKFVITPAKEGGGKLLLIFEPDERMINAMKVYNRRLELK